MADTREGPRKRWWWSDDRKLEHDLSESVLGQRHQPKTGADLIASERRRQVDVEGWTLEHDDGHLEGDLASAAAAYALNDWTLWPWPNWWNPGEDPERRLVKAGALIAAEIDRLQRRTS